MKKIFSLVAGVSLLIFATSCDPTTPPEDNSTPPEGYTHLTDGRAVFYGTEYTETYNYEISLATDMEVDEDGYYASAGHTVTLDLYSADSVLAEGTYTLTAENYDAGALHVEYTNWSDINDNGESMEYGIKSGTVEVAKSGEKYKFTINLVDSLDQVRKGYFFGNLMIYGSNLEPMTPTQVTLAIPSDSIFATNYGDFYETGTDNIFLEMWNEGGDYIALDLFAETGATALPVGTFEFAETGAANTILPGSLFWGMFPSGSYAAVGESYFWLEAGSVTIALNGSEYTVTVDVSSHFGSTFDITYTGAITFETYEDSADEAPAKKALKKGKKVTRKHMALKR